jgi:hypothetical protein
MTNKDNTMRFPVFHGTCKDDVEKHWFNYEAIWPVKRIKCEATKIMQLETTFKDRSLTWYMKYKAIMPAGHAISLAKIKQYLLREFHKPK